MTESGNKRVQTRTNITILGFKKEFDVTLNINFRFFMNKNIETRGVHKMSTINVCPSLCHLNSLRLNCNAEYNLCFLTDKTTNKTKFM